MLAVLLHLTSVLLYGLPAYMYSALLGRLADLSYVYIVAASVNSTHTHSIIYSMYTM